MKKISFIVLPMLFLIYLITETYLKMHHSSLCATKGCHIAGSLLNIKPIYLNYLGVLTAFGLFVIGLLSYKKLVSEKLFFTLLYTAIFFETVMIGFQYFASPQMCLICMIVYGSLILIAIFSDYKRFFSTLPFIIAPLIALNFLAIPNKIAFVKDNGLYLIHSDKCKHCAKVKKYLNEHEISYKKINIKNVEARNFLKFINTEIIPDLIIKKGEKLTILSGDENIIKYFDNNQNNDRKAQEKTNIENNNIDILSSKKDGCGISIFQAEEESCDK